MKKYKYIDLFAGCGGLSEGFEKTGKFELVSAVEWDYAACETLINRLKKKWNYKNPEQRVLRFDIQRIKDLFNGWERDPDYGSSSGLDYLVKKTDNVDIIIGGPPCQAYSIAGRIRDEHGMKYDYRNYLFESYIKVVDRYKPKLIVFENVPGMLSAKPNGINIIHEVEAAFNGIGYFFVHNHKKDALIDFTKYGVPQRRKRLILLAVNKNIYRNQVSKIADDFFKFIKLFQNKKIFAVKDYIGDLPKFFPVTIPYKQDGRWFSHKPYCSNIKNHIPRFHNNRDIEIFRELSEDLESNKRKYISIDSIKKLYTKRTGKTSNVHKYYVLRWDEPSNTIPAHLFKDGLRHIHPDPMQARSITAREAACLQTFDRDFEFLGSISDQYKMVGNAVPPKFSYSLAKVIFKILERNNNAIL